MDISYTHGLQLVRNCEGRNIAWDPNLRNGWATPENNPLTTQAIAQYIDLNLIDFLFLPKVARLGNAARTTLRTGFRGNNQVAQHLITDEQKACLLMDMYLTWLYTETEFAYSSGQLKPFFLKAGHENMGMPSQFAAKGNGYVLQNGYIAGQCSSVADSFLALLWAFGFEYHRLLLCRVNATVANGLVASKAWHQIDRNDVFGYDGTDIQSRAHSEREGDINDTILPYRPHLYRDFFGKQSIGSGLKQQFADLFTEKEHSNCLRLCFDGSIYLTNRYLFVDHFCTFIKPENGGQQFQYPHLDPRKGLRYRNGHGDVSECYNFTQTIGPIEQFSQENNPRRRFYAISLRNQRFTKTWKHLEKKLAEDNPFYEAKYTFKRVDNMDYHLDEKSVQKNMFAWLKKYHECLYIEVEENDWLWTANGLAHPRKLINLFQGPMGQYQAMPQAVRIKAFMTDFAKYRKSPSKTRAVDLWKAYGTDLTQWIGALPHHDRAAIIPEFVAFENNIRAYGELRAQRDQQYGTGFSIKRSWTSKPYKAHANVFDSFIHMFKRLF